MYLYLYLGVTMHATGSTWFLLLAVSALGAAAGAAAPDGSVPGAPIGVFGWNSSDIVTFEYGWFLCAIARLVNVVGPPGRAAKAPWRASPPQPLCLFCSARLGSCVLDFCLHAG